MKKNQIVDLEITDLSYEAMGVAHDEGLTIFVTNALPGEIVSAKILKVKKNFAFAKIEKIKKESPDHGPRNSKRCVLNLLRCRVH